MIRRRNLKTLKCQKCGVLLSREYPWNLCPKCWQEKYHAPPGTNYFPPDKTATKCASTEHPSVSFNCHQKGARASSQVRQGCEGVNHV